MISVAILTIQVLQHFGQDPLLSANNASSSLLHPPMTAALTTTSLFRRSITFPEQMTLSTSVHFRLFQRSDAGLDSGHAGFKCHLASSPIKEIIRCHYERWSFDRFKRKSFFDWFDNALFKERLANCGSDNRQRESRPEPKVRAPFNLENDKSNALETVTATKLFLPIKTHGGWIRK